MPRPSPVPPPPAPARWVLRPGVPVLRRDGRTLQVGLAPPARALVGDHPDVRALLDLLRTGSPPPTGGGSHEPSTARAWRSLVAADLVVQRPPARGAASGGGPGPAGAWEAAAAWAGSDAHRRLLDRARLRVAVRGPVDQREDLQRLLAGGGVGIVVDAEQTADPGADLAADLVVVLRTGEVVRDELDALLRAGIPHLPVWSRAGLPRLGPLVVPGTTACLRCVDAHEGEADPRHGLVLAQAERSEPAPVEPALRALALSWVARDVLRYAEGEAPTTWSATVVVGAAGPPVVTARGRHPHCGCAWDVDAGSRPA